MMNVIQNDRQMVRNYGEFSIDAWLAASSEASAEYIFSNLSAKKEAEEPKTQQQDSSTPLTSAPANADPQQGVIQEPLCDKKQFFVSEPVKTERVEEPSSRKSTGPRTSQGKQRSKFNALKHGFFSKAVLLEGESATEFKSFLNELRQDRQPQGKLETVLVEYLAVLLWRRRRYLEAERAEISKSDFICEDFYLTNEAQTLDYVQLGEVSEGEQGGNNNLRVIRGAISILDLVRIGYEACRSNKEEGSKVFSLLFPKDQDATAHDRMVRVFHAVSKLTAKYMKEKGITEDADSLNEIMCQAIQAERERLAKLFNFAMSIEEQKTISDSSAARIPSQEALDRFLCNDAHTSREIDRTMQQLERLQRMRRGQSLPPQLDVKIS